MNPCRAATAGRKFGLKGEVFEKGFLQVVAGLVTFLHTADWQIGMKAGHVAPVADRVRQARLETARRLMALARERQVDFVVIAGDVFEDNLVSNEAAHQVSYILSSCSPIPVYVLPGNHDPLTPDSVYNRPVFREGLPANVHVLRSPEPVSPVPGVVLLPAPVQAKNSPKDPTENFPQPPAENAIKIGVAHGSLRLEGRYQPDDFPIAPDAAARHGLDYLALGHWHSFFRLDDRTVYPGTPEPTGFEERESGTAALVTIPRPGGVPLVEKVPVASLCWEVWRLEVAENPEEVVREIRHRVEGLAAPDRTLLRLILTGRSNGEETGWLADLESWLRARLLYLHLDWAGLNAQILAAKLRNFARTDPFVRSILGDLAVVAEILGKPLDILPGMTHEWPHEAGPAHELLAPLLAAGLEPGDVEEALQVLAEAIEEAWR